MDLDLDPTWGWMVGRSGNAGKSPHSYFPTPVSRLLQHNRHDCAPTGRSKASWASAAAHGSAVPLWVAPRRPGRPRNPQCSWDEPRMQEPIEVGRLSSYLRCSPTVVEIEPGTLGSEDRIGSASPCYRGQSEPSSYLSSSPTVHVVMQNTITCRQFCRQSEVVSFV